MDNYDVIVAGSGIAGSLAAAGAAKGGAKVLLPSAAASELIAPMM